MYRDQPLPPAKHCPNCNAEQPLDLPTYLVKMPGIPGQYLTDKHPLAATASSAPPAPAAPPASMPGHMTCKPRPLKQLVVHKAPRRPVEPEPSINISDDTSGWHSPPYSPAPNAYAPDSPGWEPQQQGLAQQLTMFPLST